MTIKKTMLSIVLISVSLLICTNVHAYSMKAIRSAKTISPLTFTDLFKVMTSVNPSCPEGQERVDGVCIDKHFKSSGGGTAILTGDSVDSRGRHINCRLLFKTPAGEAVADYVAIGGRINVGYILSGTYQVSCETRDKHVVSHDLTFRDNQQMHQVFTFVDIGTPADTAGATGDGSEPSYPGPFESTGGGTATLWGNFVDAQGHHINCRLSFETSAGEVVASYVAIGGRVYVTNIPSGTYRVFCETRSKQVVSRNLTFRDHDNLSYFFTFGE